MRKKKSIAKEVESAAVLVQKLVKLKAADFEGNCTCVTCGKRDHWSNFHGAHFISRKWLATKLMEENIHPCCPRCNGPLGGNMIPYTIFMIDNYGREFVETLEKLKHESRKYYRDEVEEIKQDFKSQIDMIKEEKGL